MDDWNAIARKLGFAGEQHMWDHLYTHAGHTISELAETFSVGIATISRRLDNCSIPKRRRGGAHNLTKLFVKLWYADQRLVRQQPELTATRLRMKLEILDKFTRITRERRVLHGVCDNQPDSGS